LSEDLDTGTDYDGVSIENPFAPGWGGIGPPRRDPSPTPFGQEHRQV